MAERVTICLPEVSGEAVATETSAGRLSVPINAIAEKTVTVDAELVSALRDAARDVASRAAAPYSGFHVGAALVMADDPERRIFTGANAENASYGGTICAERTAITQAASHGFRKIELLVVSCIDALDAPLADRSPCGICRQVISEFASEDPTTLVVVDRSEPDALGDVLDIDRLLPHRFSLR